MRRNDRRLGVANGERGVVAAVDRDAGAIEVRVGDRRFRLDAGYLERGGGRGGPAVAHGYATTGHSAQGLTCDRTFRARHQRGVPRVGYTALSRGRHENRLYAVAREPEARDEFSPACEGRDALADAFGRSTAQTLASDVYRDQVRELNRVADQHEVAERAYYDARRVRAELERRPPHPMRVHARARHREALGIARQAEVAAGRSVDVRRKREEALSAQLAEERSRLARIERMWRRERPPAERVLGRDVGMERKESP